MSRSRAAVVVFPGSNGDRDLAEALERAGFSAFLHPSSQPITMDVSVVGLPGGFAYGDYWRAGMLASRETAMLSLPGFIDGGGLVIGICNGFQILVEAGLLPGALTYNDPAGFRHHWLTVERTIETASPWFHGIPPGVQLRLPIAHGEGRYLDPAGFYADRAPLIYQENPNGSVGGAAALLDGTGRVLGIMPHPERASDPDLGSSDGLQILTAARRWLDAHRTVAVPQFVAS